MKTLNHGVQYFFRYIFDYFWVFCMVLQQNSLPPNKSERSWKVGHQPCPKAEKVVKNKGDNDSNYSWGQSSSPSESGKVWFGWVLWHINPCKLFDASFSTIYDLYTDFEDNIFKWALS